MNTHQANRAMTISGKSILFLLMVISAISFASEGGNLLKNPSFELGLSQWKVSTSFDSSIRPDVLQVPGMGRDRSNALSVRSALNDKVENKNLLLETAVTQCVRLQNAPGYRLSAQFQYKELPKETISDRLEAVWFDNESCAGSGEWGFYADPLMKSGWQSLSCSLKPTIVAKSVQIRILQRTRESGGVTALWDDVSLIPLAYQPYPSAPQVVANKENAVLPYGQNYLINPNLLKDLDSWNAAHITSKDKKEVNEVHVKWDPQGAKDQGSAHIEIASSSGFGTGILNQCVNLGGRKSFESGAKAKSGPSSTGKGDLRLRIVWFEDLNCKGRERIDSNWKDHGNQSAWTDLKVMGLKPIGNAKSANVEITGGVNEPGKYSAYLDNVYFIAVEK